MIRLSKITDERQEAGAVECWLLHGAVGLASDWRKIGKQLATHGIGSRAVDLWRFLDCCPMPLDAFGTALGAEASGEVFRGSGRILLGYSMGGRLALHTLLENQEPWQAAVIISAHPGLENASEQAARRAADADWASRALLGDWASFLTDWSSQPILSDADLGNDRSRASRLSQRRREIARSFVDWSLGEQKPLWERLPEIRIPMLWITGAMDHKFSSLANRAASLMPNATHICIPNAGHRVPWQNTDAFCETIANFTRTGIHDA